MFVILRAALNLSFPSALSSMPTILTTNGWRLFFYSNENDEPIHVHARKAEAECKFWLNTELFEIAEAWSYHLTPRLRREIRRAVFEHFDLIVARWREHFGEDDDATN